MAYGEIQIQSFIYIRFFADKVDLWGGECVGERKHGNIAVRKKKVDKNQQKCWSSADEHTQPEVGGFRERDGGREK